MSAVKEAISHLIASGLDPAEAAAILAAVIIEVTTKKRSSGADRTARWREKKASQSVTERHIVTPDDRVETVTNRHNVTGELFSLSPLPPPKESFPHTPFKEITPPIPSNPNSRPSVASDFPADGFEQFWKAYPRREGKQAAKRKFDLLRKNGKVPFARLISGVHRYAEFCRGVESQYIKHPSTWLNAGCWDDELSPRGRETNGFRWNGIEGVI